VQNSGRKPESDKSLRRPRRRCENNIKIDVNETICWSVDRIHLAQERDQRGVLVNR
jgi:hypothetical protein